MNLNQLLYFSAAMKAGNYTRAAEELDVSQPVVYRAVKSLEKAYDIRLVERVGNRLIPTAAGRRLYEHAARIASLADVAEQTLVDEKRPMSGNIRIGSTIVSAYYVLPQVLSKWMAQNPRVTVHITTLATEELYRLLLEDQLDIILARGPSGIPGLRKQLIFSDQLVVVSARNHPVKPGPLSIVQLSNERMVLPPKNSAVRREIEEVEDQFSVHFKAVAEADHEAIKRLCMAGVGVTVLPKSMVAMEVAMKRLRLLTVEGFPRSRAYFVVYRTGKTLTPEMQSLIAAVTPWTHEGDS